MDWQKLKSKMIVGIITDFQHATFENDAISGQNLGDITWVQTQVGDVLQLRHIAGKDVEGNDLAGESELDMPIENNEIPSNQQILKFVARMLKSWLCPMCE